MHRTSAPEQDVVLLRCSEGCTLAEIEKLADLSCGMVNADHPRAPDALRNDRKEKE